MLFLEKERVGVTGFFIDVAQNGVFVFNLDLEEKGISAIVLRLKYETRYSCYP